MSMPAFKKLVDEIKSEVQQIDPEEFQRMRQAGEDFEIIDVREKEESEEGMIPGAVSLPRGILESQIDEVTTDFDRKIVCYCDGGSRSVIRCIHPDGRSSGPYTRGEGWRDRRALGWR